MAPWMKVVIECRGLRAEPPMALRAFLARLEREHRVRTRASVERRDALVEIEGHPLAVILASGRLMEYAKRELGARVDIVEEHLAL